LNKPNSNSNMIQDTISNMAELTAAPTASTLASLVSDEMLLLEGVGSLCGTQISSNSDNFQFESTGRLSIICNSQESGFHDLRSPLLDLNGQLSNPHGPNGASVVLAGDPQRITADPPSPITVVRSLKGGLAASRVNSPDTKHTMSKGTQVAQRKRKSDFKFYNPVKKIFSK